MVEDFEEGDEDRDADRCLPRFDEHSFPCFTLAVGDTSMNLHR